MGACLYKSAFLLLHCFLMENYFHWKYYLWFHWQVFWTLICFHIKKPLFTQHKKFEMENKIVTPFLIYEDNLPLELYMNKHFVLYHSFFFDFLCLGFRTNKKACNTYYHCFKSETWFNFRCFYRFEYFVEEIENLLRTKIQHIT